MLYATEDFTGGEDGLPSHDEMLETIFFCLGAEGEDYYALAKGGEDYLIDTSKPIAAIKEVLENFDEEKYYVDISSYTPRVLYELSQDLTRPSVGEFPKFE